MSSSTSMRRAESISEVLTPEVRERANTRARAREEVQVADSRFADIKANAVFKIMFGEGAPEAKKSAVAAFLAFEGTKEENRERIKEYTLFCEYLQNVREEMATEIIKVTDTKAFAELQNVYNDMNNSLIEFDELMKPLTDILDAIYTLRSNNATFDTFAEIKADKEREAALVGQRDEILRKFNEKKGNILLLQDNIAVLGEQKSFFGFGGVKQEAREEIAMKQNELAESQAEVDRLNREFEELNAKADASGEPGKYAAEKAKLRELLDITSDEHIQRQNNLVASALNFVKTAKERTGAVRSHLNGMNEQIERLADANGNMTGVYAILSEGIKEAEGKNQEIRGTLLQPEGEDENMIAKMTREQKKLAVEEHITLLDSSSTDTLSTYADLTSQAIRIKSMKDANNAQVAKVNAMNSRGIAGVADRISVVLQAVSSAALGESSAMANDTLARMSDNTNMLSQKEVMKNALGINERNEELMKAIDDLSSYGEVVRAASDITREGVSDLRANLDEIKKVAQGVQDDIHASIAINAEVGLGVRKADDKKPETGTTDPFGF